MNQAMDHWTSSRPRSTRIRRALEKVTGDCGNNGEIAEARSIGTYNQPVYLGGPCVYDDVLFRRLDDRLLT